MRLSGFQGMKNHAAIWLQTARNLTSLLSGGGIHRTAERIHTEYASLANEWQQMESAQQTVRTAEGLSLISMRQFREQYVTLISHAARLAGARRLIEFGCGDGLNMGLLHGAFDVSGFDLVPERARRARERLPGANIWVGDATKPQVPPDSFDLAYACHAIEQMQEGWREAIMRMREAAPYVLLMEPFYERKDIHGKVHSRRHGYFRGTIKEVLALGFTLVDEMPVPYLDIYNPTTALLLKRL